MISCWNLKLSSFRAFPEKIGTFRAFPEKIGKKKKYVFVLISAIWVGVGGAWVFNSSKITNEN